MASLTIRNLDDDVMSRLRVWAAANGRSMEEEARLILCEAVEGKPAPKSLACAIRARFAPFGGVEMKILARQPNREPPSFDETEQ